MFKTARQMVLNLQYIDSYSEYIEKNNVLLSWPKRSE